MNDETHVWATAYAAAFAVFYQESPGRDTDDVIKWAHTEAVKLANNAVLAWRNAS